MRLHSYLRAALATLAPRARRRLLLVVSLLAAISVIDLVALTLVLAVTTLATRIAGLSPENALGEVPAWIRQPLEAVGLSTAASMLSTVGLCVVALFVLRAVLATAVLRRVLRFLAWQESHLTTKLVSQLMRAPLTFHLQRRHIEVMTDVTVGAESLMMRGIAPAVILASELVLILFLALGLAILAPVVAGTAVIYFALTFFLLNGRIAARTREAGRVDMETTRTGMVVIQWALAGFREITVRGVSEHFVQRLRELRNRGALSRAEVAYLSALPRYFLESALVVGMAFAFAVQLAVSGFSGAFAGLALFAVAGFRLLPSLQRVQTSLASMRSGQPFGERALQLARELDETASSAPPEAGAPDPSLGSAGDLSLRDGIDLRHVTFRYPGAGEDALGDVSLFVPARRMTALVGSSGSGKSTLVDVLLGLLTPRSGSVLLDGVPLERVRKAWLRRVGYVPQNVFLMPTSIRDNIALGEPRDQVDDDDVWSALRRASLDETVRALPSGLDHELGEGGTGLSGGQRQRLGIARALYHSPSVLLLDEATSALDVETEAELTQTLDQLTDLTKVIVAHRLSTVRHADQVVFLRDGTVVAAGGFDEVSAAVPDFARHVQLSGLRAGPGGDA